MFYDNLISLGIKAVCNPITQKILNKIFRINPDDFTLGFKKVNRKWYSDIKNWPKAYEEHQLMIAGKCGAYYEVLDYLGLKELSGFVM